MTPDIEAGGGKPQERRELLKKLGIAAGALVWSTPVVQTIMTSAAGATTQGNGDDHDGATTTATRGRDGKAAKKCIYFRFEYTDGVIDEGTICGTNNVTRDDVLEDGSHISVSVLHISCSDPFPDGYSNGKSNLDGKRIVRWIIVKDGGRTAGQICQGSIDGSTVSTTTTRPTSTTTTTRPASTTTTTRPASTTTTTRRGGGSSGGGSGGGSTTSTTRSTTTTTRRGGADDCDDDVKAEPHTYNVTYASDDKTNTTRRPTTTTTRRGGGSSGGGSGGGSTTTRPTTTTTRGSGADCGSPGPGKDISHMDWVLCRGAANSSPTASCSERYGVQYEFGSGWGHHPSGPTSSQHCLAGLSWRVPPSGFSFTGFGSAVSLGGGAYRITLPADVTVFEAYSKCGQVCRRATNLGGNTWRFDPC